MIGKRFKHIKRGSTYTVVGLTDAMIWDKKDGEKVFFSVFDIGGGEIMTDLSNRRPDDDFKPILVLVVTMQISNPPGEKDFSADFVIYQGDDDKLWARPKAEFIDGRFEELT